MFNSKKSFGKGYKKCQNKVNKFLTINPDSLLIIDNLTGSLSIMYYQVLNAKYLTGLPEEATINLSSSTLLYLTNSQNIKKELVFEVITKWCTRNVRYIPKLEIDCINSDWEFGIKYRKKGCLQVHGIIIAFKSNDRPRPILCELGKAGYQQDCPTCLFQSISDKEILESIIDERVGSDEILFHHS